MRAFNDLKNPSFSRLIGPALLAAVLVLIPGGRSPAATQHDGQLWFPFYLTAPLTDRVLGYFEVNPRYGGNISEIEQLILRPALGYQLTPTFSLWQGYAWVTNYQPSFREEHRIFQQATYSRPFPSFRLLSRTRLEERWIQDSLGTSLRAREMLRLMVPVSGSELWAVVLYDEIFVNLNSIKNGPESGFDQNRAFIGINRTINRHLNIDVGYQNQLLNTRAAGLVNRSNHIILIQTFINF